MCLWYVYVSTYCMILLGKSENNFEIGSHFPHSCGFRVRSLGLLTKLCTLLSHFTSLFSFSIVVVDWKQGCGYVSR